MASTSAAATMPAHDAAIDAAAVAVQVAGPQPATPVAPTPAPPVVAAPAPPASWWPCAARRTPDAAARPAAGRDYDAKEHLPTVAELAASPTFVASGINVADVARSTGLSRAEAARRLQQFGRNVLTPPKELPEWAKFLLLFTDTFMVMLQVAGWCCILASGLSTPAWDRTNLTLGIVLFAVVILNVIMTYVQNRQTASVMAGFRSMMPDSCRVIREGVMADADPRDLVVGDIVYLQSGKTAPADVRLLAVTDLQADFSSLTGEPDAVRMRVERAHEQPHEAKNLLFSSCGIVQGEAYGVVIRTADKTFIGGIAALASSTDGSGTTLERDVHSFVMFVAGIALVTAIVFFSIGVGRNPDKLLYVFINAFIVVLVANVPEGLPATVTSCLTITAKRMGTRNVFVKRMQTIETLGSATVICSDKTGTLTMNRMTVVDLWFDVSLAKPPPKRIIPLQLAAPYHALLLGAGRVGAAATLTGTGSPSLAALPVHALASAGTIGRRGAAALMTIGPGALALGRSRGSGSFSSFNGLAGEGLDAATMTVGRVAVYDGEGRLSLVPSRRLAAAGAASSSGAADSTESKPAARPSALEALGVAAPKLSSELPTPHAAAAPVVAVAVDAVPDASSVQQPPANVPSTGAGALPVPSAATSASVDAISRGSSFHAASPTYFGSFSSFGAFQLAALQGTSAQLTVNSTRTLGGLTGSKAAASMASWRRSNTYLRVVIAAGVCNKAAPKSTGAAPAAAAASGPRAFFDADGDDVGVVLDGDASDQGLYRFVADVVPVTILRALFPKVHEIPFNSTVKWSYAVVADPDTSTSAGAPGGKQHVGIMKGAPEVILAKCSHYLVQGAEQPIDDAFLLAQREAYEGYGSNGKRVLGFAYRSYAAPADDSIYRRDETACPKDGLVFLGLVALQDPPKPGVPEAIAHCHAASIKVTMVTGDHPLTAEAIARKVGIITGRTAREVAAEDGVNEEDIGVSDPRVDAVVYSGTDIATKLTTPAAWDVVLSKPQVVFARTTPQQKLTIVENYQRRGEVVAVTGDGVNDSPALKKADIGVAMAISGSSVAKAAADVLLMDDNFASIVAAVSEGRLLFDNLKKSIAYTLAHILPELMPVFLNVAFSFPLALPGLIILSIDLVSEQAPAISFAYEAAEGSIMMRPPRDQARDRLVAAPLLIYSYVIAGGAEVLASMFSFFMVYVYHGIPIAKLAFTAETHWQAGAPDFVVDGRVFSADEQVAIYAESVAAWYAAIVLCQFWHVWLCKTRVTSLFHHNLLNNFVTILGAALAIAILVGIIFIPGLQWLFYTANLSGVIWPAHLVFPVFILAFTEFTRYCVRVYPDGAWAGFFGW